MINRPETADTEGIVIICKNCGQRFYAAYRIIADDVIEIAEYVRQGHIVAKVLPGVTVYGCTCARKLKAR